MKAKTKRYFFVRIPNSDRYSYMDTYGQINLCDYIGQYLTAVICNNNNALEMVRFKHHNSELIVQKQDYVGRISMIITEYEPN